MLLAADRITNELAVSLAPTMGWLTLLCGLVFAAIIILDRERWTRFWLRAEDPRALGFFRITFGLLLLGNLKGMWGELEFLFTDEGLFLSEAARQSLSWRQFEGYGELASGDTPGFFDLEAIFAFLKGPRYSFLLFWDTPSVMWAHVAALIGATVMFMVGWKTRISGFLAFVLTLSLYNRNPIFWTGADVVFRCFFFYLVLSRSGHAYSVDNWLRCRRLRKENRLSERDGPGGGAGAAPSSEHPEGLEAVYRLIPAWPRMMMIFQLATIYFWTGCAKTGNVWWKGDSLYYSLNLDHFARVPNALLASIFGTTVFRLMTWVVHFWQIGFPILVLGLIVRWARREGLEAPKGGRGLALRSAWVILAGLALAIMWVGMPVHYEVKPGKASLEVVRLSVAGGWVVFCAVVAWGWWRLRERPPTVRLLGTNYTLDLDAFFIVFFGRRLWLSLGLVFHLHILVLMNIGMFAPIMIIAYIACLNGSEVAVILRHLGRAASRLNLPGISESVKRGERIIPAEDPELPWIHRDRARLPTWSLFALYGLITAAILACTYEFGYWQILPLAGFGLLVALAFPNRGKSRGAAKGEKGEGIWGYGPLGRAIVGSFILLHLLSLAIWSIPDKDCTNTFRKPARKAVGAYVLRSQTYQSWNMFAPNPIRVNAFLEVMLTDSEGEVWDLRADVNSPRNKVMPWFSYHRMGKITRRIMGDGKWYQKWFARYHCREWAKTHGGETPKKVELIKRWYPIPRPERTFGKGGYLPSKMLEKRGKRKKLYTVNCERERDAQLPNHIRERYGLPLLTEDRIHRVIPKRESKWKRKQEKRKQEKGEGSGAKGS